jgi:transposase InsO family protein
VVTRPYYISKKVFVYYLKSKSAVCEKFIEFKNMIEKQTESKIKILRTDNGTEYVNKQMETFLKKNGIIHQTTNVYTPQQNGVAERMNRTLVERAKCLLFDAGLKKGVLG